MNSSSSSSWGVCFHLVPDLRKERKKQMSIQICHVFSSHRDRSHRGLPMSCPSFTPSAAQSSDALRHSRPMPPPGMITRTIHRIACAPPSRNPTKEHHQFYASPNAPPLNTSQNNAPSAPLHSHPRRRRRRLLAARPAPLPRPASPSPPHGSRRPRPRPPSVVRRARPAVWRRRRRGRPLGRHGSRPQHQPIRRVLSLPTFP